MMTPQELYDRMKKVQEAKGYYFNKDKVYVKVQLSGIRFSVIGELNNGQYILYQNEANIFEAPGEMFWA